MKITIRKVLAFPFGVILVLIGGSIMLVISVFYLLCLPFSYAFKMVFEDSD